MKPATLLPALLALAFLPSAKADTTTLAFTGSGVSATVQLTYGTATDAKYPQALELTGISGTFTDTNIGISNTPILGLIPINHATPEMGNTDAPADFSRFAVTSGLPPEAGGYLTYSNLFYPNGSPQTATSYPFSGGILDIYGILFDIGNGQVVDLWSNGTFMGLGANLDYGAAVATSSTALDYESGGVQVTPEPGTWLLLATGLATLLLWRKPYLHPHASR